MKIIVGLGNPGRSYAKTRHNMGFLCIDRICDILGVELKQKKFKGLYEIVVVNDVKVLLIKPQTYMNLSGEAITYLMGYYSCSIEDLLVIYDDLDLPCGKIRLREKGNDGGHNGLKSINSLLKSKNYKRIRIGINKDPNIEVVDYVLGKPSKDDLQLIKGAIDNAALAALAFVSEDFPLVMNKYNRK